MIIYNTTFHIDKSVEKVGVEYLRTEYIPKAAASGFLMTPRMMRVLTAEEDEGASYSVQFHVKNVEVLNFWLENEGRRLQQQLVQRFGRSIAGFTTLLDELKLD